MKANHDPEKLLELFRKSKKTVQTFVEQFQGSHGRKPKGDDLECAPEYVRVCIKNCKKIKIHLEKLDSSKSSESSDKSLEDVETNKQLKSPEKPKETVQIKQQSKSKVWGSHLNRSNSESASNSKNNTETLTRTSSYNGKLSAMIIEDLAKKTRKNLSIRRTSGKASFFETMGDEPTLQGLIDATETTMGGTLDSAPQKIDPLVLFHPELSMDGLSQHGQHNSEEVIKDEDCEIESIATNIKTITKQQQVQKTEGKSMNFLNSVKLNKTVEAKERTFNEDVPLSFSGLFTKSNCEDENPMKRKNTETGEDPEDDSNDAKRQRLSYEDEEAELVEDNVFSDENVDSCNIQKDSEDKLLPFDPSHEKEDNDKKNQTDRRKPKKPSKLQGMVSSNFVKIDMKKKNYVRGKTGMTGAKYKRLEWKRKVQGKFGRSK